MSATLTATYSTHLVAGEYETAPPAPTHKKPLKLSGALDEFESFDVTTVIGREFPTASLRQWMDAPNSDELLRDLAITSEVPYMKYLSRC